MRRSPLFPPNWVPSLRATSILWRDYAHFRSVISQSALDANGKPVPWYTYPAIEFLQQLDFRDKVVFEYGAGMSTLFWARVAKRVVSLEDNERWFNKIAGQAPANCRVILETDVSKVPDIILQAGEEFDVIVVDGPARGGTRLKCCRAALQVLRKGGLIILDNSDWLPESSKLLREHGLLEVDMTGFAPICGYVQTTSLYFDRAFNVPPLLDRQPSAGRGARLDNWERPFVPVSGKTIQCEDEAFRAVENEETIEHATPAGPRSFHAFTYLARDDVRCIAIVDADRQRVLLARHLPRGRDPNLHRELERITRMSWDEYCAFVDAHDNRRYVISPAAI